MQLMNGHISIESKVGKGTTFKFYICVSKTIVDKHQGKIYLESIGCIPICKSKMGILPVYFCPQARWVYYSSGVDKNGMHPNRY